MKPQERVMLIALAIQLRDKRSQLDQHQLHELIKKVGEFKFFSYRQLSNLCGGSPSHSSIARIVKKGNRRGGKLNVSHLEDLRDIMFEKSMGKVDFERIKRLMSEGTSIDTITRFTDVPKSSIYRKVNK